MEATGSEDAMDASVSDGSALSSRAPSERDCDVNRMVSGNLIWPLIGWDVIQLRGVLPCAELSYCNPVVPPPLNACVSLDENMTDILFRSRTFYRSGEENSRPMTSDEYYSLQLDIEDLTNLESFGSYLTRLHATSCEISLETMEGGVDCSAVTDGIPLSYREEHMFVCSIIQCRSLIHLAKCFRGDLLRHLYPHAGTPDRYIHLPLIGREETSCEGMMLTNASLLEVLGLLTKRLDGSGNFDLGPNVKMRHVFLYGDALSVSLYGSLYDKILRQITQLGNEEYIKILLDAQSRIFVQKGAFHQLMHQLAAIYSQFYGGFMQAFQADSRVKRVSGKPLKDGFQCHHHFAVKLYNACNRFLMRKYCHSRFALDMTGVKFASGEEKLGWMLANYCAFRTSWEESPHQPSRMVALFLKSMRSYLRCKHAISKQDGWLLEIESCHMLSI